MQAKEKTSIDPQLLMQAGAAYNQCVVAKIQNGDMASALDQFCRSLGQLPIEIRNYIVDQAKKQEN